MTIQSEAASRHFVGNGTSMTFPCDFKIFNENHLQVFLNGVEQTLTTHYTVSGVGDETFNVIFVAAPADGVRVSVVRVVPFLQEADYLDNDEFPAETHERALDLLTMMVQQLGAVRAVQFPTGDPGTLTGRLPAAAIRAGKLMAFDALGEVTTAVGTAFGILTTGSANEWTALQTFQDGIRLENTSAVMGEEGLGLVLARTKNPAEVGDELAPIRAMALNSAGVEVHYSKEYTNVRDVTAGATRGERVLQVADGVTGEMTTWLRGRAAGPALDGKRLQFDEDRDTYAVAVDDDILKLLAGSVNKLVVGSTGVTITDIDENPTNPFVVRESDNVEIAFIEAEHAAFTGTTLRLRTKRAANSAFSFLVCTSDRDGTPAVEFRLRGDGVMILNGAELHAGSGSPEGVVTASIGSVFHRLDGGAGTTLYVKESGAGNTGWVAK